MPNKSDYEIRQEGYLSQNLAAIDSDYVELAGSDPKTSIAIATLRELGKQGYLNLKNPLMKLALGLLNARRKALFATNEKSSDITKLGLQMPKKQKSYDGKKDE